VLVGVHTMQALRMAWGGAAWALIHQHAQVVLDHRQRLRLEPSLRPARRTAEALW
jgi:hypothetical protein